MQRDNFRRARLMCSAAAVALVMPALAHAEAANFNIPAQSLGSALKEFSVQSQYSLVAPPDIVDAKTTAGVTQSAEPEIALAALLQGTGLSYRREGDTFLIVRASAPQSGSAAGDGADNGTVQALIVTAQKREENIQDVPIAMSAFTQEDLTRSQVAGGPDLITQVPNMTFTKTNFSSYSIQLRGIGTQAISATTDAAVAVAFNNTPFIRNRFFEQEFYDLQRVEVLRGPQGTLYGRNATAGVVNVISQKPKFTYESKLSADVANYSSTRLEGMVNLPLVEDKVALRLAGAWTKRDGFDTNENTGAPIDGRDLWSTRLSLRFAPTDNLDVNLIWEHFNEDDDRLRSGKQLCKTDNVTEIAGMATDHDSVMEGGGQARQLWNGVQATFSQGCAAASLYSPESFQTPSGLALPYYAPLTFIGLPVALDDPYASRTQSTDLRSIQSTVDPTYRAQSDLLEAQVSFHLTDSLTLASETAYNSDEIFAMQDLNRFNTASGAWSATQGRGPAAIAGGILQPGPNGPVFCDPQIGCADRLVAVDLSTAASRQFSQEFRLSSDFSGPFNFSLGANFQRYDTEDKYYVFINSLSLFSAMRGADSGAPYVAGVSDNHQCLRNGAVTGTPGEIYSVDDCVYMDPNPVGSLNDLGHNYFLSRNPYKLISYAAFGEMYYNLTENLKVTGGLRWTIDKKEAPRVPSWLLASGTVGYPVAEVIEQEWREPTGRLAVDWKPKLSFTDETLLYASYAHGYKAGGANPPNYTYVFAWTPTETKIASDKSATRPKTFEPEFVDAFELGSKNTLYDGRMTLNVAAFYYDYSGYQISEIVDRSAFTRNFDAKVWGLEVEADWRPLENLRLGFKGGYENTRIADGEQAIDLMDRTAGKEGWTVAAPFPTFASNCVLPESIFLSYYDYTANGVDNPTYTLRDPGGIAGGNPSACERAYVLGQDPVTQMPYKADPTPNDYAPGNSVSQYYPGYKGWNPLDASQGHNNGEGFFKQLGGNELPNAPNFTATITADYTAPLRGDWLATLHADFYYQSEAWARVFNTDGYDKLKANTNVNLAAIFTNEDAGWNVMAYVKNVFDRTSITGAFLNSDDLGLTTNVFLTEPRLYGLRVTKTWAGGPWWTGVGQSHTPGEPYPLTIELGGAVQRQDAPYRPLIPGFAGEFSPRLDIFANAQGRDLDRGDGRNIRLTYRPVGSPWTIAAGVRFGRTNGATRINATEPESDPQSGCPASFEYFCDPTNPYYILGSRAYPTDISNESVKNREEHTIVDFAVGHNVGVGSFGDGRSSLSLGLRYANFKSATDAAADGIPNWDVPAGWRFAYGYPDKYSSHDRYRSALAARREFNGAGPTLSWDAAAKLVGNEEVGHVDLDWSIAGAVLFGSQKVFITGEEESGHFFGNFFNTSFGERILTNVQVTPIAIARSQTVTVPALDLSLGVSYEVQRIKLSTGYRWERYFNAIDGGYAEQKSYDRTFDGPYFKIAVGFGG
jgi:outer membrane receptor protein involved in Fe transport